MEAETEIVVKEYIRQLYSYNMLVITEWYIVTTKR